MRRGLRIGLLVHGGWTRGHELSERVQHAVSHRARAGVQGASWWEYGSSRSARNVGGQLGQRSMLRVL